MKWQSEEGSDDVLTRIETVLNLKSRRSVVESVKARGRGIHLTWSCSVGYGSAYAWVKEIVGGLGVWRLSDASLEEPEQADQHSVPHLMHKALALCTSKRKRNDIDSDYVCSDVALGEGAFGSVLGAKPRAGGPSATVKKFKGKPDIPSQLEEGYQLQSVSSPHVVPLLNVIPYCGIMKIWFVLEIQSTI